MTVNLSEAAANEMLDTLGGMMDGGTIEMLADNGDVLAVLRLASPAAAPAVNSELELNNIAEEDAALAQGDAASARILGADGREILSCDVGDEKSAAVIKLNTTKIYRNGPVRLTSFRLGMP